MGIRSYRDLEVWKRGMDIAEMIYRETSGFPKHEIYGMVSQMRRAASSIPRNIAEGHNGGFRKLFVRHVCDSLGSLAELETDLLLAERLGYLTSQKVKEVMDHCTTEGKQLRALKRSLER